MHAGEIDADTVHLGKPDGIAGPVQRRLDGQDTPMRTEQRTEIQQLVRVVHRRKAHVGNLGESCRSLTERNQRSVEQAGIVALGRLGPLAAVALVVIALLVVTFATVALLLAVPARPPIHVAECRPERFPVESASRRWIGTQWRRARCRKEEAAGNERVRRVADEIESDIVGDGDRIAEAIDHIERSVQLPELALRIDLHDQWVRLRAMHDAVANAR